MGIKHLRGRGTHGFSLVEILIAFTVLTVSVGAITHSLVQSLEAQRTSQETRRALDAAESVLEAMKAHGFAQVFALYNADLLDDPPGAAAPGASFAVAGLDAVLGDPDGLPGEILFPTIGTALREDVVDADLGMPRDLNGDTALDALDHTGDYTLLPVRVRVRWTSVVGTREIRLFTTLSDL